MAFCPNCGAQLLQGSKFCQNCGTQVAYYSTNTSQTPVYSTVDTARHDYRIIMVARGKCTKANARELLMDIFGYTTVESNNILDSLPAEIACNLSFQQAVYASQALTEYDIQVSVINSDGYTDINKYASSSVYENDGSFLGSVLKVLGTLTVANKLKDLTRWNRPVAYTFTPAYRRPVPPVYTRHKVRQAAPPKRIIRHEAPPRRDEPLRNAVGPVDPRRIDRKMKTSTASSIDRAPHAAPRPGKDGPGGRRK